MKPEKSEKPIEKVVRLKEHGEKEAAAGVAEKERVLEEGRRALRDAARRLERLSNERAGSSRALRRALLDGMKAYAAASAIEHVKVLEGRERRQGENVRELERKLEAARCELETGKKELARKSAERRASEKYLARIRKKGALLREKKEEDGSS